MNELLLSSADARQLREYLTGGTTERCAVLYTGQATRRDGTVRLLVRDMQFATPEDYTRQGELEAELKADFVARVTKRARRDSTGLVFAHSHPGDHAPDFSPIDDYGEERLRGFLSHRHPDRTHAALVVSRGGVSARRLGGKEKIRVLAIGTHREVIYDPSSGDQHRPVDVFDRQIRAFGAAGQRILQGLTVAIVGLGGTGSLVAQQLAHLGVNRFLLIDPDTIEESNLNRVVNATRDDIGSPKVLVAERYIKSLAPKASVIAIQGDIIRSKVALELIEADVIFGCTDSHGSRAVLQQVSYQYLIPCIDMGNTIAVRDGAITHIYGRVQLLAPGIACFTCNSLLDGNEVRRDMMTAFERKADPYLRGGREPAPAVISLNGTVASVGVTMFLSLVAGIPAKSRHVLYNGLTTTMRNVHATPADNCFICSKSGALARGDTWPLNARND